MIEDEIMYFLGIYINRKYSFFYLKKGKVLGSVCHYSGYPNCTESLDSPLRLLIIVIFPRGPSGTDRNPPSPQAMSQTWHLHDSLPNGSSPEFPLLTFPQSSQSL